VSSAVFDYLSQRATEERAKMNRQVQQQQSTTSSKIVQQSTSTQQQFSRVEQHVTRQVVTQQHQQRQGRSYVARGEFCLFSPSSVGNFFLSAGTFHIGVRVSKVRYGSAGVIRLFAF
jgi:hypothetical protein